MDLSLTDAARLMGKSPRQVRYLIKKGELNATKLGGRWVIKREAIPLSDGQEAAQAAKVERAANIAEEVLRGGASQDRKRFSVADLRAWKSGAKLYQEIVEEAGESHAASEQLREYLALLTCGCHAYHPRDKAKSFSEARLALSRAIATLLLQGEPLSEHATALEQQVVPAIGGLLRRAERKARP